MEGDSNGTKKERLLVFGDDDDVFIKEGEHMGLLTAMQQGGSDEDDEFDPPPPVVRKPSIRYRSPSNSNHPHSDGLFDWPDRTWHKFWKGVVGEFIGTFLLMYAGMGALLVYDELMFAAAAWAIIIPFFIIIFEKISGSFFNPSITLVFVFLKEIKPVKAFFYIAAQLLGSMAACGLQLLLHPLDTRTPAWRGCTTITGSVLRGFANEVFITFILVFLILSMTRNQVHEPQFPLNFLPPFGIGAILFSLIMIGGPISGASMNPARSLGPALAAGHWDDHWVYWAAPTLGALLGLGAWHLFVKKPLETNLGTLVRKKVNYDDV